MTPGQSIAMLLARWKGVLLVFMLMVGFTVAISARVGEAAVELRLASTDDVLPALARQHHHPDATYTDLGLSPERVDLNDLFSAQAESFRAIRSQLMKRVFNDHSGPRRALAAVSPHSGDGKTFVTADLAVTLAQLSGRTLRIDADMRGPRQQSLFNLDNTVGLARALSGRTDRPLMPSVIGVPGLFLLPVGNTPPNPLERAESRAHPAGVAFNTFRP